MKKGVYVATKKDGTTYYRCSITYQNKHISLGSFSTEHLAHLAYKEAERILYHSSYTLHSYRKSHHLDFKKWVTLLNFRDNKIYIKTPIYLGNKCFRYYFAPHDYYIFDVDDLFFYSTHSITRRGGHLFVADYGMQLNILSRYGIRNYAVCGKHYEFANKDARDLRYANIIIHTHYHGVEKKLHKGAVIYEVKIHPCSTILVGRYKDEITAAIAYNKAATILIQKGYDKEFPVNYIEEISSTQYKEIFQHVTLGKSIKEYPQNIK